MDRFRRTLGKLGVAACVAATPLALAAARQEPAKEKPAAKEEPAPAKPAAPVPVAPPMLILQKAVTAVEVKEQVVEKAVKAQGQPVGKGLIVQDKAVEKQGEKVEKKAEAARAAVKVAAPAIAVRAGVAANLDNLTQQMVQQLRPIFRAELRFLTTIAGPTPLQRRDIALEGGKALREAAKRSAEMQMGMNQAVRRGQEVPSEPRKAIRDAMAAMAKERLSTEQYERLRKELEARDREQREVVALNLVVNMDKLLVLGADQREKLAESILSHWDDKIYPTLEMFTVYESYFPTIPDQYVNPVLNDEQRKIWRGAQKINFGSIRHFNFFNGQNAPDAEPEDEDEKAALAAEAKK